MPYNLCMFIKSSIDILWQLCWYSSRGASFKRRHLIWFTKFAFFCWFWTLCIFPARRNETYMKHTCCVCWLISNIPWQFRSTNIILAIACFRHLWGCTGIILYWIMCMCSFTSLWIFPNCEKRSMILCMLKMKELLHTLATLNQCHLLRNRSFFSFLGRDTHHQLLAHAHFVFCPALNSS